MKKLIIISILMPLCTYVFGQSSAHSLGPFHIRSISGAISFENLYRNQYSYFNNIEENQNSLYFNGGLQLNLNSYLYNPEILSFSVSAEYSPESRDEKYLLVPDRSEVRTLRKLNMRAGILSGKPVSLTLFTNLSQNYYNRELLTNIKSNNRRYGGNLAFRNKYIPLTVSYLNTYWDQTETLTGRVFIMENDRLETRLKKSFTDFDNHELLYSHENYDYSYSDMHNTENSVDRFRANNIFYLNRNRKNSVNSLVTYIRQNGYYSFSRLEANERIVYMLTENLKAKGVYNYHLFDYNTYLLNQHRVSGDLDHKLYESLRTNINIEYANSNHDLYSEKNLRAGAQVNYTKKIRQHQLNISYHYFRHKLNMTSESTNIIIRDEEHILTDADIVLLEKPYADPSSVIIKDITGTIIYQEGIDYLVSEINNFTEIRRIPGGLISDNQAILVDYTAIQPGSYSFSSVYNNLSASFLLFNNMFEVYYRGYLQDYKKIRDTEFLVLNYYTRNVYGARLNLDFATAGIEYDNYNSTIIPYERIRYYLNLNKSFNEKLLLALNCNINDYKIIENDLNHRYYNFSSRLGYHISSRTSIIINAAYLKQQGRNIDLDLFTGKAGFQTSIRQLFIRAGIQNYIRYYLDSKHIFYGTYIELSRKF